MANVSRDFKSAVSTFNKQMIRLQEKGKTGATSFKEFDYFSGIHQYCNLYRTDKNGNLVLKTNYKSLSDAEADAIEDLIDKVLEAGPVTLTGLRNEYKSFLKEYDYRDISEKKKQEKKKQTKGKGKKQKPKKYISQEQYEGIKDFIHEESLHRVYYDTKNHKTTAAVENKMTKTEAMNMLVDLYIKGKGDSYTGKIYPQSIKAELKKQFG